MKHFNYNPFTWKPKEGKQFFLLLGGNTFTYSSETIFVLKKYQKTFGIYKTKEDARNALKIMKEAIINNVKE